MDSIDISRRRALSTLGATGVLALAGCVGDDDDADDTGENGETGGDDFDGLRVGILGDLSETNPDFGYITVTGFLSGLAYKNGDDTPLSVPPLELDSGVGLDELDGETLEYDVDGTTFEMHVRNTEDSPRPAGRVAQELANDVGVDLLVGTTNSDSLLRVTNNVVDVNEIPLFGGTASTSDATADADRCHPLLFRTTETSGMSARAGAEFIANDPDLNKVALFGEDYSFGRSVISLYRQALEERGVEIVTQQGEELYPRGFTDWDPEITAVNEAGADVIVYGFTAQTGTRFFSDFTTDEDGNTEILGMQVVGDMPSRLGIAEVGGSLQERVEELGEQFEGIDLGAALNLVNFGPLTTRYMWNQYDNPINESFIEGSREAYGVNPDLFSSATFTAASAIVQAIEAGGEVSSDAIVEQTRGMTVEETPKGENAYEFLPENNQAFSPLTLTDLVESPADSDLEEDQYWPPVLKPDGDDPVRIEKEDVMPGPDDVTCDLT